MSIFTMAKDQTKIFLKHFLRYNKSYQRYKSNKKYKFAPYPSKYIYLNRGDDKVDQIILMLRMINISIRSNQRFQHWIDESLAVCHENKVIGNMPPDYSDIVKFSIPQMIEHNSAPSRVSKNNQKILKAIEEYVDRILVKLKNEPVTKDLVCTVQYFENMKTGGAKSLEEALQRILFWSSLFWQSGHKLVGLGRLDKVLQDFSSNSAGMAMTEEKEVLIIMDFLTVLHEHYKYKSSSLLGDIGQIIILGGLEDNGHYFCNSLTYGFIEALKRLQLPDPKVLLRVAGNMPDTLLELALQSISTGIGSPLLSNDEVVISALRDFGFQESDAFNYVVSACWEPVSYGNSLEQNNLEDIDFVAPLVQTLLSKMSYKVQTYDDFITSYENNLRNEIRERLHQISTIRWEPDPLFSLFTKGCIENGKDISEGGALYNDYGILSEGMGNVVNSLLTLKHYVFDRNEMSLKSVIKLWREKNKDALDAFSNKLSALPDYFGHDKEEGICLTNRLIDVVVNELSVYRNRFDGKVKFGLSSPSYISRGSQDGYTFDGRKEHAPLMVHISSKKSSAYTELISFAAQLHYCGFSSNANVIDFFVSPDFIANNFKKFCLFLRQSIRQGFFQMQMNVVSSKMLIAAREKPDEFPNLIVRVWGFSAYFNDLPEEYKDILIARAKESESRTGM